MLVNFIIALVAVIAFGIFEKIHLKTAYNFQTAWFKYLVGLALGTIFKFLAEWKFFQYLEIFAFVVAFLYFFWIIVNALKIKNLPK